MELERLIAERIQHYKQACDKDRMVYYTTSQLIKELELVYNSMQPTFDERLAQAREESREHEKTHLCPTCGKACPVRDGGHIDFCVEYEPPNPCPSCAPVDCPVAPEWCGVGDTSNCPDYRPRQQSADDPTVTVAKIAHVVSQAVKCKELCLDSDTEEELGEITKLTTDITGDEHKDAIARYVRVFCENLTGDDVDRIARMPATKELREALK